ncbi:MAG: hypothetical protein ACI4NZ_04340 [Candidatus Enterousia sp.]
MIASVATAVIAGMALYAWKREFIGKKKIELAAEIMTAVIDFQDNLIEARLNTTTQIEQSEIKKWLEDVNSKKQTIPNAMLWPIYPDRLQLLSPIHRLNQNFAKSEKFTSIFNKSLIYFGDDLYKLLVELYSFLRKIRYASEMLYEDPTNKEFQQIAFSDNDKDEISKRIFAIGEEIKLNLEPLYKDQQTKWKKLAKAS